MIANATTEANIHSFLQTRLAAELNTTPDRIDIALPLTNYRLDSVVLVTLAADLEDWLSCPINPAIFWEFDTIADVSTWLVSDYLPTQRA